MIALIVGSTKLSFTAIMSCTLRSRFTVNSLPLVEHLGLPLLPAEALAIHDRQPHDLDLGQGLFDVFELARLDDGDDEFHGRGSEVGGRGSEGKSF